VTRPLDDQGLLGLQELQIQTQDHQLSQLSSILQRQKGLGIAINQELALHMELLDDLSDGVDKTRGKLADAQKSMNRLG